MVATGAVTDATLSPDGLAVLTSSLDGTARITRRDGSAPALVLRGHLGPVTSASFSPDGRRVLTTGADGTARIWDVTWPALLERLIASTTACLSAGERVRLMGETERVAAARSAGCVPGWHHAGDSAVVAPSAVR